MTAQKGLNEPRYPAIPAIMKARRMPIEVHTLESLGLDSDQVRAASRTHVEGLSAAGQRSRPRHRG